MSIIPDDLNKPARCLLDITPHRTIGGFNFKGLTPCTAEYESYNEKHAILTLALCHDVLEIRSQPKRFGYIKSNGKKGSHVPDFEILTPYGSIYIEVKAIENLLDPKNLSKYRELATCLRQEGINYCFLTNNQLEVYPRFDSVWLLSRYLNVDLPDHVMESVREIFSGSELSIQDLMRLTQTDLGQIYSLIAQRHICFDWDYPLDINSMVSLPNHPHKGLTFEHIQHSTRFCGLLEELALGREPTDQYLVAAAKAWRQHDNLPGIWGVVGGFDSRKSVCYSENLWLFRGAQFRRSLAPGENAQNRVAGKGFK